MSLLLSTGIWGFITSAAKKSGGYVSTFVSGLSGWIINHNGDAEFKSIYARDKIVTNEYVYNRIRVTEDEEVVTSNGKILSATDNEDGTYTVYLDLREGDVNPFAEGDLLQGYYHSTENSGVIYAVQKLTVIEDPNTDDQSMLVTCENGSLPYKYMIIVRIGNTINLDRQSFIKISSRTNCQYFHDGINSFAALYNPDNVKCVLGKADMGLVPSWAQAAIEGVRKWFGLIADGVILRGTFILKSSGTTVEEELDGMANKFVDIETSFEIREGQISSKVLLAETYAENAENSATSASGSALIATAKASEAKQTADGFVQTVTAVTKQAVDDAVDGADQAITDKVSTVVEQSATQWKVEVLNGEDTVMAAINADASGVKIQGDKVEIDGMLIARNLMIPIHVLPYKDPCTLDFNSSFSFDAKLYGGKTGGDYITLPNAAEYEGIECTIFNGCFATTRSYYGVTVQVHPGSFFLNLPHLNNNLPIGFVLPLGKIIRLKAVSANFGESEDVIYWYVLNPEDLTGQLIYP